MKKYGQLPKKVKTIHIECKEMMFYQYLPIKMNNSNRFDIESRLYVFYDLIIAAGKDFAELKGNSEFTESYMYITAKHMYQAPNTSFNRMGWHSDGFMTDDINYIWCDKSPTIFNSSKFKLTQDDVLSMAEMEQQAQPQNDVTFKEFELLRLDQYNIHRVAPTTEGGWRTFVKISFSKDKYDLVGNSHNYLMKYNWEMRDRQLERNIPQIVKTNNL